MLNKKSEQFFSPNHYYVFVSLYFEHPKFYIVPSKIVAKYIKSHHEEWLKRKAKNGKSHNNTSMRKFRDIEEKYLNCWKILGIDKKNSLDMSH